jgi:hypothetical protein
VPVFQSFTLFRSSVASGSRVNTRTSCRNRGTRNVGPMDIAIFLRRD